MNLQTNVKYLDGLNFKLDWYRDRNGNTRTLPVSGEKHTINPVTHTIQLKKIPATNTSVKIIQSMSRMGGYDSIIFEEVKGEITKINQFTFDSDYNLAQFHPDVHGDVCVEYDARGQFVLDADSIAVAYDSKGNVLEYLSDLIRSCNNALENTVVVGDLANAIEQIKAYISSSMTLNKELYMNLNLARVENDKMKIQVPLAQINNTQLREAIIESQDSINKLTQVGGKSVTITPSMWGERQSDGFYKYIYLHKLGTKIIDFNGYTSSGEWFPIGERLDNENLEIWNDTNDTLTVNVFARAYAGV